MLRRVGSSLTLGDGGDGGDGGRRRVAGLTRCALTLSFAGDGDAGRPRGARQEVTDRLAWCGGHDCVLNVLNAQCYF